MTEKPKCPVCAGSGKNPRIPDLICWYCDGTGVDNLPPKQPK